jgi:hypothetical protein
METLWPLLVPFGASLVLNIVQDRRVASLKARNAQLEEWLKPFNRDGKDGPGGSRPKA